MNRNLRIAWLTIGYLGLFAVYIAARIWYGKKVNEIPLRQVKRQL